MQRIALALLLVAACSQTEEPCPPDPTTDLVDWLERYERVRECVIAPLGDTVANAATVAMLQGADCRQPIAKLTERIPLDEGRWQRFAKLFEDPSPAVRGAAIESADLEVDAARIGGGLPIIQHPRFALPVLKTPGPKDRYVLRVDGETVITPGSPISFNGARVRGTQGEIAFHISGREYGYEWNASRITKAFPSSRELSADELRGEPVIAAAELVRADKTRIIVRRGKGAAYTVSVTHDRGQSWETISGPTDMRLVDSYQDPESGTIELRLLGQRARLERHWISLATPTPRIQKTWGPWGKDSCRHLEYAWRLDDGAVPYMGPDSTGTFLLLADTAGAAIDCRGDRAIVLRRGGVLERCGGFRCAEVFRSKSKVPGVAALLDDQTWIYAAAKEGIVSIQREAQPAVFYRLPSSHEVVAITVLHAIPYLVIDEHTNYTLLPI